jgi:hypothetical protein
MSLVAVTVFEILAALAFGFVIGRIWQIRRDELDRRNCKVPPVSRIPRREGGVVTAPTDQLGPVSGLF